jgi:SAM-dependent methyltransferase
MNQQHLELCSSDEWAEAVQRWIIPWVLEDLDVGDDVLEVGPGPGRTTEVLAATIPHLTAVEIDPTLATALAQRMGAAGVEVIEADGTDLPFARERFTAVLSFTMLHHLPSSDAQDGLFSEAQRVLRPGGVFAGTDSVDSEDFRALHIDDICVPVDPDNLMRRLEAVGLQRVQVDVNEYGFRFRGFAPGLA